jgi:hypothetical protein
MDMVMISKGELVEMLHEGVISVMFEKTDGTMRTMRCTLREDYITAHEKKTDRTKTVNENVLPVWDLDAASWRSFRVDSIKDVYK